MKSLSQSGSTRTVDALRAEVRELREAVAGLETKLSELETTEDEANPWNVWPYCWFTSAWNYTLSRFHSFQLSRGRRELERYNARNRQLGEGECQVLHLIQ